MFVNAIEKVASFTRPIHSIARNYKSTTIQPGAATLFLINADGWALTCKHVANQLAAVNNLAQRRDEFTKKLAEISGSKTKRIKRELEKKYGFSQKTIYELHNRFVNCVEGVKKIEIKAHENMDVALIHFKGFSRLLCDSFPVFALNGTDLKQGKYLCRLGFPFVEFTNFAYDRDTDQISWTSSGRAETPRFPIEGMVTRHIGNESGEIVGFELSTPGLRGQSGGPAFDVDGVIWGMQAATAHLDLNFDVNQEVLREGKKKKVSDNAFIHVGQCVHVNALKDFMREHNVAFKEG